ncbi:MAG: hypothetical protein WBP12_05210 [Candidatus Saccharimonas sp.]
MGWFADFVFGKPQEQQAGVDQAQQASNNQPGLTAEPQDPHREADGSKIIPEVTVSRVEYHPSGDMKKLELWMELYNESQLEVEVKRFEVLGQSTELGRFLKPGEKYEVRVYRGDTPRDDSRDRANMQYRIVGNGDYFQSDHMVEFKLEEREGERWYLPCELQFVGPVRDI